MHPVRCSNRTRRDLRGHRPCGNRCPHQNHRPQHVNARDGCHRRRGIANIPPILATPTSPVPPTRPLAATALREAVIAIDPGHNGANAEHPEQIRRLVDAGGFEKPCNTTGTATNSGYSEAQFNLDVALLVQQGLEDRGATVHLTRAHNDGVGPCVDERGRFGAKVGADLLLSIHADGADPPGHGFHVIHPTDVPGYTDDISAASSELAVALRDALVDSGLAPSTYLGIGGLMARADLGSLNLADVPTVMVESGNMRNPDDARRLQSSRGRQQLADSLINGITAFLVSGSNDT